MLDLYLKPSECCSFSLKSGGIGNKDQQFELKQLHIQNIHDSLMKFFGSYVYWNRQQNESQKSLQTKLTEILARLKNGKVRNDQRLRLHSSWVTQSIRFMLTLHNVSIAAQQDLEDTATKFLKEWNKVGRSATVDYLYHPRGLGLPSLKTIYQQAHSSLELSYTRSTTDSLPPPSETNAVLIQPLVEQHQNGEISTSTMSRNWDR